MKTVFGYSINLCRGFFRQLHKADKGRINGERIYNKRDPTLFTVFNLYAF